MDIKAIIDGAVIDLEAGTAMLDREGNKDKPDPHSAKMWLKSIIGHCNDALDKLEED